MGTCIIGFDSAWTDSAKSPGAICCVELFENGQRVFHEPMLATFDQAAFYIETHKAKHELCLVCIDQPTIVPNETGSRAVERTAASVISWVGGGVQPSSRSKSKMFGKDAPIWRFKKSLNSNEDAVACITAQAGVYLAEVFPALALLSFDDCFMHRLKAPKYNPANRRKFRHGDWRAVCNAATKIAQKYLLPVAADWSANSSAMELPKKSDQDKLDALLCALIGLHWLYGSEKIMIGDLATGFIISPCSAAVKEKLELAANKQKVTLYYS